MLHEEFNKNSFFYFMILSMIYWINHQYGIPQLWQKFRRNFQVYYTLDSFPFLSCLNKEMETKFSDWNLD